MENIIKQAAKYLQEGMVISLPTETVYSLSVNACDNNAVGNLYNIKGRRKNNPLALFISNIKQAEEIVEFNKNARILAEEFLPGSLTLILPKKENKMLSPLINEGLQTIAVRMPKHNLTLDILNNVDFPVVGTSANPSGMAPATCANEVKSYFPDPLAMIIDGGKSEVGIASTILDLSKNNPEILRQGSVTKQQIEQKLGIECYKHQ